MSHAWDKLKESLGATPGAALIMGGYAALNRALSVKALRTQIEEIKKEASEDRHESKQFREATVEKLGKIEGMLVILVEKK